MTSTQAFVVSRKTLFDLPSVGIREVQIEKRLFAILRLVTTFLLSGVQPTRTISKSSGMIFVGIDPADVAARGVDDAELHQSDSDRRLSDTA